MSLDSKVKTLITGFIANLFLASFLNPCLGLDNPSGSLARFDSNKIIFVDDHKSPFEVEHITDVDNEEDDNQETDKEEAEEDEGIDNRESLKDRNIDEDEASYNSYDGEDSSSTSGQSNESASELNEGEVPGSRGYEGKAPPVPESIDSKSNELIDIDSERDVDETTDSEEQGRDYQSEDLLENPELLAPPRVSKSKSQLETKNLKKLVYALQFGSLTDSINLLELMVASYPYDPDYKDLLQAAKNLRHADIWYQYQRRLQLPPPSAKPKVIYKLIKMKRNEKPINELKQASWFHLIKGKSRLINSTN